MSTALKAAFSSIVSLSVVAGFAVSAAPPAVAAGPDDATVAVTDLLDRLATDFVPQVASGTALAEQLPTLAVTPAGSVRLRTAFSDLVGSGGRLENAGAQETLSALASYIDGADGGGWAFTSSAPHNFSVVIGFTRTVTQDAGFDIRDEGGTLSLSTGSGIDVTGTLTGSFTLNYDPTTRLASLTSPSMAIATTADLPAGKQLDAGLGILGVRVTGEAGTEDYRLTSNVVTTWANPDNDAAGSLAYDNPATPAALDGELAADGAGTGLVTAARTGSLGGTLVAEPRGSSVVAGVPSVGATVTLSSATPATFEAPAVTAVVPTEAEPFLTLTPRDLAAGLSQAASAIIGMQDAQDVALPLMRGSLGNAVDAVGGIKAFLADQVPDADPTDQTPGQPKFASLQDMLVALDSAAFADSGWTIDVLGGDDAATFDPDELVANFTIRTTRGGVADLELNPLGAPTTGAGTFTATGLSASGVDFNGPQDTAGAELVGRKVSAGTSYGTIDTIVDGNTLTLTPEGWSAGTPTDGTTFSIEAADPKTGAPELADTLAETTGISSANADLSTATVTPTVDVTLPMALDLSAPLTYAIADGDEVADCDPSAATAPCPFQQIDASGLGRVITSLPLASDRIMLRQSDRDVLVADADITSPVQISAQSGYLGLTIGGDVEVTVPDGEHLQVLSLRGTGDIPIPAFVEQVRLQAVGEGDPDDDVFTQVLGGSVEAGLVVTVDEAPDAFAPGEDSTGIAVTGTVAGFASGEDPTVTPEDDERAALLQALDFEADNPLSLFSGVQGALDSVGSDLTTMSGGGLDTPIPLVGSSVGNLIGGGASGGAGVTYTQQAAVAAEEGPPAVDAVPATTTLNDPGATFDGAFIGRQVVVGSTVATIVGQTDTSLVMVPQFQVAPSEGTPYLVENELLGAVHVLQAMTPATLQETLAIAQSSLGNGSTIDFGLVDSGSGAQLRLDLTWERDYGVSRPVSLEFDGGQQIIGAGAGGELSIDVSGTVSLRLLLPLTTTAMEHPIDNTLVVKSASEVGFDVTASADGAYIGANLGPISVDLGTEEEPGSVDAGFGVTATGAATGATPSIADFFTGGFEVAVDNGGADCEGAADILCAEFPVFVSGSKASGPLTVVTTLGDGDDLADVFGGSATVVTPPSDLQSILEGKPFEFGSLADGLKQYLFYAEVSMRTASNGGEMPVVGKDLQAGADFMGQTRKKVDNFIAAEGDITLVSGARDYLTKTLADELGIVVNGADGVIVDFTCNSFLEPPAAPTAAATTATPAPSPTTQYVYKVVSYFKDKSNVVHDSVPSGASTPAVTNAATLSTTNLNTVTWAKVSNVTGYKVLRATQTTAAPTDAVPDPQPVTSAYVVVKGDVAATATSYIDNTGTAGTAYTPVSDTAKPYRMPGVACADDDSVTEIEGVTLALKLGQGNIDRRWGCKNEGAVKDCVSTSVPVDLGLPGLSLKTGEGGSVSGKVGWALDVKIGMSRSSGFYIDTKNVDEFEVGLQLALDRASSGPDLSAQLSIIDVDVRKKADVPEFVGHFGIDLRDGANGDGILKLSEIPSLKLSEAIVVSVDAKVDINWHLEAAADAALPGIGADFRLIWSWGKSTDATPATGPSAPRATSGLTIEFNRVTLNAGKFFGDALKPYVQQLVDATKPLQPVIDTIFTPMPVISDLSKAAGGKAVTIASLAETFNTLPGGARIKPFLDAIKTIKALTSVNCTGATDPVTGESACGVVIGSFNLSPGRVATTSASAGSAKSMMGTQTANPAAASQAIAAKDTSGNLSTPGGASKLAALKTVISIPVIEDPTILFDLITGGDIALVEFDSGPLALGFQFQKSFGPIYAPPPVMMVIGGGASVTLRIAAGFDTYGIRRAIETGDGAEVLDSLYFKTVDANGKPIPVVQFTGYLEAGASVSIGILEVGVLGGIKLTVGFYWNDPNNDGKFRLYEFSGAVANNPICLFNVGGELSLYIKVFVVIGFSPFSVDFDFTLVNIKLLDFNLKPDCTPPPPRLGGTNGKVLYIFAGKFGGAGPRGHAAWDAKEAKDETWVVRQVPAYDDEAGVAHEAVVEVRGLGLTESFPDPGGTTIDYVVLDGRGYGGKLTVSFTGGQPPIEGRNPVAFTKTAVVFTGAGDDVIRTGEGHSWVDSGGGSDLVTTADRTDLSQPLTTARAHVAGGPGADTITVGNGNDTVSGDGSLTVTPLTRTVNLAPAKAGTTTLTDALNVESLTAPTAAQVATAPADNAGADQIAAGLGTVVLAGNGGNDTIGTANDSTLADSAGIKAGTTGGSADKEALYRAHPSILIGGAGGDVMKSGSADDKVYTGTFAAIGESDPGSGDLGSDVNVVDTGTGSDKVYGSNGQDFVTTASKPAQSSIVYGGASSDVLTGGLGTDELYGGPDNDYVVASPATVGAPGSAPDDVLGSAPRAVGVLPGAGSSQKLLVGGTGSDRIYGADGPSRIFGDTTVDPCTTQSDPVSAQPVETTNALDASDLIFGGNGIDVVNAGGGRDWVYAAGAADRVCGNSGDDRLYGGDGDDLVFGGTGADQGFGEGGADQVYGNDDGDSLYGGFGDDRLQGNAGGDWLDGGADADVILGGTSKSGRADGADVLYGAGGSDLLVGDNAQSDVRTDAPYPTDLGSSDVTLGGNDYLVSGDDEDSIYGGLGDDSAYGGTGDDYTEGNPGTDRVWGEAGDDDIVGGSSQLASGSFTGSEAGRPDTFDFLYGGVGQDVIAGDNARVTRTGVGHPLMTGRGLRRTRAVDLADEGLGTPAGVSGGDVILGGDDTDLVFGQRGNDDISLGGESDYGEGGPGVDLVHGDAGDDDVVGGSFTPGVDASVKPEGQPDGGDVLAGDAGEDVVLGDNGSVTRPASTGLSTTFVASASASQLTTNRVVAARSIAPYDLGDTPTATASGPDTITGDLGNDVLLGQGGNDRVDGGTEADYAEGGQDSDLVLGGEGDDDVVGGSSATFTNGGAGATGQPDASDNVNGGGGSDLVIGDNGLLTRVTTTGRDWRTNRADAAQAALVPGRAIVLYDLNGAAPATATTSHAAADSLSGQAGVDVILGQDGDDRISGGSDDDYVEGEGGADVVHGDRALTSAEIVPAPGSSAWTTPAVDTDSVTAGQDDITGGSIRKGYRDGNDTINGDGDDDFVVSDNGAIARVVDGGATDRVYAERYGAQRTGHAKVRVFPPGVAGVTSTRFCTAPARPTATSTCEVAGSFGNDVVFGDEGQDVLYGQDGADTIRGGAGDDDIYGELGNDLLYGEDGEDAILGDRGGVQNRYEDGSRSVESKTNQPPAETYRSRLDGSVSRETDLLHDVNGVSFVGAATAAPMPLDGITYGGIDRIRGGAGNDSIHAGAGDDLANGDSGGDRVFGDRGADVMWGGLGKVCVATDAACLADPGVNGEYVDHLAGGKDEDVIDWRPRGVYGVLSGTTYVGRTCSTGNAQVTTKKDGTTDPCSWFEMTDRADDVAGDPSTLANNQHHQGIDWIYGGWDRDVMQGDQAANGPNPGDRMIDWNGVYNFWSHCNAAYGGWNDIRSPSPAMEKFINEWATGLGAGRPAASGSQADVLVPGTSAYDELALVNNADGKGHGTGSAYPTTPGHFDDEGACAGF